MLQAKAYDYANNLGESGFEVVKVNNSLKDRRAPSVKIVSPRNRATVYGVVKVQVSAEDDTGISRVEFYIDNKLVATDCEGPYEFQWDTRTFKNGLHTLTVKAYDLAGKTSTAKIMVYVFNRRS